MNCKYINYKEHPADGETDLIPVLFPTSLSHDLMAKTLKKQFKDLVIISAGFVKIVNGDLKAYGESHSLNISSKPDDTMIINLKLFSKIVC